MKTGAVGRGLVVALLGVVGAAAAGQAWKQAQPGYRFAFPRDHASHPEYKIEWWYYTGNLAAADARRFGYQLTFFRVGVDPAPTNPSRWAVRDLFMAHFAITDVQGGHRSAERLNRAGIGWAGAATEMYHVWNEDWSVMLTGNHHELRATSGGMGLELSLEPGKSPVLHGDRGFSQKGSKPGNASHYYSLTRMPTRGTLTIEGQAVAVSGDSWMDHEFGTSFLEPNQSGWDWLSVQLDDGTDLMVFQIRRKDGSRDSWSSGTLVDPSGAYRPLSPVEFTFTPGRAWRSAASQAVYPVEWSVQVPGRQLSLRVAAVLDAQELHAEQSTGVTYWEGAIGVDGTSHGRPVRGRGYLEMTGYAGRSMGDILR